MHNCAALRHKAIFLEARTKLSMAIINNDGSYWAQSSHGNGQTLSNMALGIVASNVATSIC